MTLEQFAKKCGVTLVAVDKDWGGKIGYREKDHPNSTVCGFRTENAAYKHWLKTSFGDAKGKAVRYLLRRVSKGIV